MSMNLNDYENKSQSKSTVINPEFKTATPYFGRVVSLVNCGIQHKSMWDAGTKTSKYLYWKPKEEQVKGSSNNQTYVDTGNPVTDVIFRLTVELPKLRVKLEDGDELGPMWVTKSYGPRSKELKSLLEAIGSGSVADLINTPVSCTLGTTSGGKAKITSISLAPEEVTVPALENDAVVFDFYNPNMEMWGKLPKFVQDEIKSSLEFEGSDLEAVLNGASPDGGSSLGGPDGFDDDSSPF